MAEQYDPQYWIERAQLVMEQNVVEDAKTAAEINRIITLMYAEIAKEIFAFYAKFATSEGLSVAEAKKVVDAFDVVAFKAKAKEYVKNKDFSEKANKELKKYNVKMKISREKLLKENLDLIVKSSTAEVEKTIESGLVDSINREVKEQAGILGVDLRITEEKAESIANSKFHKVTWSERLWDDMDLVREEVERITTNVVVRGRHPNEYVADFKKKTGQTTYNAKRLLTTESARAQTEAQRLSYLKTLGEDGEYEFLASKSELPKPGFYEENLDLSKLKDDEKTKVCPVCNELNGKVFKVKNMVPGVNAAPIHPHCRCSTAPRVGNWRDKFFEERKGKYRTDKKIVID